MNNKTSSTLKYGIVAIAIALAVFQTTVIGQDKARNRRLTGVWEVTTTPRDCTTGTPIPARAFRSVITFHKDGTMSATNPPVSLAAPPPSTDTLNRTASYGIWKRRLGWGDYVFKFVHLRFDGATRAFRGKQEGDGSLVLSESGDEFTSDGTATVFDTNDNPVTIGCASSVGTRFDLEP